MIRTESKWFAALVGERGFEFTGTEVNAVGDLVFCFDDDGREAEAAGLLDATNAGHSFDIDVTVHYGTLMRWFKEMTAHIIRHKRGTEHE